MTRGIKAGLAIASILLATSAHANLKIGDQRGNARAVMEAAGVLSSVPYHIEWHEFPNAAPVLEAINSNHLDAGMLGDASLTFAAASGVQAKAIFASNYFGNALITGEGSTIASASDLKGKRIATVKGSSGHALTLAALKSVGLRPEDVTFVYTMPAEATLALDNGAVDAVASWEPYVSFAVQRSQAKIFVEGRSFPALNYLAASNDALANKADELRDFTHRLSQAREWGYQHPEAYAQVIARLLRLPISVASAKVERESNAPFNDLNAIAERQEATISLYAAAGLITNPFPAKQILDGRFLPTRESSESGGGSE